MSKVTGNIDAPILSVIAKEILALVKSDQALRALQGANAARACYFASGTLVTPVPQVIAEAHSGTGEIFFQLVIVFTAAAGAGNYRIDGPAAGVAVPGGGLSIPAGGGTLTITGNDNIRNFSMVAVGGVTMPFSRYLFK